MKHVVSVTVSSIFLVLLIAGCGSGSKTSTSAGQMVVAMGDSPTDGIIAFSLTINSMTLMGGSNPTVISSPTQVEFVRNAGTFQPIVTVNLAAATYTGATLMLSNPKVVSIDPTTHLPTMLTATVSTSTVNVTFDNPLIVSGSSVETDFDLDLANSVTISGTTATINPVFHVSAKVLNNGQSNFKDVHGTVTSVTAPTFMIASREMTTMLTITTDSNTVFEGITGISQLTAGMIVEVDAQTQSDGSLLAKRVEVDENNNDGVDVEGFVTTVTGTPATHFTLSDGFDFGPIASLLNLLGIGTSITVNIGSTTTLSSADCMGAAFCNNSSNSDFGNINLSGLSVSFDANNLGKAQRVDVLSNQRMFSLSGVTLTADSVRLRQQSVAGTVSNFSGSTPGTFTLTVASDSAFAQLSGQTTLTVQLVNGTQEDMTVANGGAVRVRGLLFFSGSGQTYTLVASHVSQP